VRRALAQGLVLELSRRDDYNARVNKSELLAHLARLDRELQQPTTLCVFGSAVLILLDEPDRTSVDIDVAAPYSQADFSDLQRAAAAAGLPVNPDEQYRGDHIEWITSLRLCLPKPAAETDILLWQGTRLLIKTVAIPQLIASKLIRYDEIDQTDIQFLLAQTKLVYSAIVAAVGLLPAPFDKDALVLENLRNLKADWVVWRGDV